MTLNAAIVAWVAGATGIAASRVRWGRYGVAGTRPDGEGAWVSLLWQGTESIGGDWTTIATNPLTFADKPITAVDTAANRITVVGHGLQTGDGPVRGLTDGTLPAGMPASTDLWAIRVSTDQLQLALTFLGAVETPTPIDLTDAGSGSHRLAATADTVRAGAELVETTHGTRTSTLTITCYGGSSDDGGSGSPRALIDRIRASAALTSVRAAMQAENAAIATFRDVRDVSANVGTVRFEPRCTCMVRIHGVAPELTGTLSRIDTVVATLEP